MFEIMIFNKFPFFSVPLIQKCWLKTNSFKVKHFKNGEWVLQNRWQENNNHFYNKFENLQEMMGNPHCVGNPQKL